MPSPATKIQEALAWPPDAYVPPPTAGRRVPRVENGYIDVPESPGFVVELNEDVAAKHPYGERNCSPSSRNGVKHAARRRKRDAHRPALHGSRYTSYVVAPKLTSGLAESASTDATTVS